MLSKVVEASLRITSFTHLITNFDAEICNNNLRLKTLLDLCLPIRGKQWNRIWSSVYHQKCHLSDNYILIDNS